MNIRFRAVLIAVALLGFIWAQAPATPVWSTPVAHTDFAWDRMNRPLDGVGDSPMVP